MFWRLALVAGLMALVVRAMVPAGFMLAPPGQGAAGPIPIVLCTEAGTIQALMAADGSIIDDPSATDTPSDDPEHSQGATDHQSCVFAHTVAPPVPAAPILGPLTQTAQLEAPIGAVSLDLVPGRGLAAPPPPATAPPVHI